MKLQRVFLYPVLVAALIGGILVFCVHEPHYQGRSLTSWLEQCSDTPLMETQRLAEAQEAIRAIGAKKALPGLMKLAQAKEDRVSTWIIVKTEKLKIHFMHWHSAEDFQQLGIAGFEALGTNAAPAVGRLTILLDDNQHAFTAVRCLVAVGIPAEAAVSQALTNKSVQVRQFATQQFGWVTDDTEDFLAHMKKCLSDADGSVRFAAVQGIGMQTHAPDSAIPLLLRALRDNQDAVSACAAKSLADFGTNAMQAVPDLSNAVESGSQNTANAAVKTLAAIAPKEAIPILMRAASSSRPVAGSALGTLAAIAPDEALPIIFDHLRSPEPRTRAGAVSLMCSIAMKTPAIEAAIEKATTDDAPVVSFKAKNYFRDTYLKEHPEGPTFMNEPSFNGKQLGEWLKMSDPDGSFTPEAHTALRSMGTNAIPALLERLVFRLPPGNVVVYEVSLGAVRGFICLGEATKQALPRLLALMESTDQDIALHAMLASCGTGSNAIPFFIKGLTNQFATVRGEAANYLSQGVGGRYPELSRPAIPLFLKLLNDPDENVRTSATNEFKEFDPEAAAKAGIK